MPGYNDAMETSIRPVQHADWPAIRDIFNHYVATSPAAYPEEPVGADFFQAKHRAGPEYPFLVVDTGETVVGFAYLSALHPVATMRRSAQLTYFIHPDHTGVGLGGRLLDILIERGREMGIDTFLAHISSLNEGSIRFHTSRGFTECGRFRRIGTKHGHDFDLVWMQRLENSEF